MESENAKLEHEIKNTSKRLKELTSRIKQTKLEITDLNRKLEQWWELKVCFPCLYLTGLVKLSSLAQKENQPDWDYNWQEDSQFRGE